MHIVVTGASGMLGTALLTQPWTDVTWTGVDVRPLAERARDRARFVRADVRDTAAVTRALRGADVVVHAAAALPSHRSADIRSIDVDGTASVLRAARAAGVDRFVHISSTAVYGLPEHCPTPEDYPCRPVDPYSAAKLAAEQLVAAERRAGLCAPVLRPKTFLGEERLGLFAMLFEWAEEGHNFPLLGGGRCTAQMLDVTDLCEVVRQVCLRPDQVVNDTFNVGAREFGSLREDFQAVLDAAGHGKRVVGVPVAPAVVVLRALAALRLSPVYKRLVHKLTRDSHVSTDKAVASLGFAPRYSNAQTLLRTYHWWRANAASTRTTGRTHRDPWKQGVLRLAKALC
ncbi:NAD-dependent epimerase/dehydratase family protein [Goodfellowiella coeruleoviolacea]|uniref:Nucleoside-diphosphate-sugar epimerase n=1 Tax=Goodfellowiella coeruleoviolacea TaxID=334858 RepID=A0AAE3GEM5_9PSEU|nr:NAD-dependent epimerase/dehydratase family protein [Goodfellowiella coeruleoviolacea]MCP2166871.1 Nucleoside-diphosphate-sugar epimerase [Goodfellowiella coeruleoviolacea]